MRLYAHGFALCALLVANGAEEAAAADNWLAASAREEIRGDLAPGERDVLLLRVTEGTRLDLDLRWEGGGSLNVELHGPRGTLDLGGAVREREGRWKLRRWVFEDTGAHHVVVRSEQQASYELALRTKGSRSWRDEAIDAGGGATIVFPAAAQSTVKLKVRVLDSKVYAPRVIALANPMGEAHAFEIVRERNGRLELAFEANVTGAYEITVEDPNGESAQLRLDLRTREARASLRVTDLRGDPLPLGAFPATGALARWGRLDRLAELDGTERTYQHSSFDRTAGNDDGLSGIHTILRLEGNESVVFDAEGPGIVERIHFSFRSTPGSYQGHLPNAEQYRIRFFFDGEATPRIDLPVRELVSGTTAPFLAPAVGNDLVSPGAPFLYTPIAFASRLVIRTTGPAYYLHVNWRRFDPADELPSFDPNNAASGPLEHLLSNVGKDPHGATAFSERTRFDAAIAPAEERTLFALDSEGWISGLVFDPAPATRARLGELRLRIAFDGESEPSVDCPLDLFFGSALGEAPVHSLMFCLDPAGSYRCWWPMPFASAVRMSVVNEGSEVAELGGMVYSTTVPYGGRFGRFRAQAREETPPPFSQWLELHDYRLYEASGQGKIVGLAMAVGSEGLFGQVQPRTYLEGDEHVFLDGLRTPAHHGTGTEEIWNWAWYEAEFAVPFTLPLHGFPARFQSMLADYTSGYRVMVGDPIPYASEVLYGVEQGPLGFDGARYLGVAFAYHRDQVAAQVSDVFDVGNPISEAEHGFTAVSSTFLPAFASSFEGERLAPIETFDGRREGARSSFFLTVDPSNRGVWLRRVFDAADGDPDPPSGFHFGPGQRARVLVDGREAGIWHSPSRNLWRRWRESEFALPASLTAGASRLLVTIEPHSAEWNAFEYRAVSRLR